MNFENFHFLRPAWLLASLLVVPALAWAWRRANASGWERICEPHLLRHLIAGVGAARVRLALATLALGWLAACLAQAGPTWERLPQPAFADPSRTVFVLGLAPSMEARDVAPSRMARARHKLQDALDRLGAGSAALVVYREEAFAATPMTDDLRVLRELVPLLETNLAPGRRVLPARGIEEAVRLLDPVGLEGAHIVLVSDGTDDDPMATHAAAADSARRGARVSVLGVAGSSGTLEAVASAGHGSFAALSPDDRDLAQILEARGLPLGTPLSRSEHQTDDWRDLGVWLVWVPLLLAPLAFRKGWLAAGLALLWLPVPSGTAHAGVRDWFERPDQRGARAFVEEQYDASAKAFEDPAWRAAAMYRAGDFESSAGELANLSDPESSYNRGNALARAGRLEEALAAYDATLAAKPDDPDARFNRDLVKQLLQEEQSRKPDDASSDDESQDGQDQQSPSTRSQESGSPSDEPSGEGENQGDDASDGESASSDGASQAEGSEGEDSEKGRGSDREDSAEGEGSAAEDRPEAQVGDSSAAAESGDDRQSSEKPADSTGGGAVASDASPADGSAGASGSPGDLADQPRPAPSASGAATRPEEERKAARWMARLPDDPGGLLREKIRRDYLRRSRARLQGDQP